MKFEVAPPGQMETIKIPILSSAERLVKDDTNRATAGKSNSWNISPKKIAFGALNWSLNSLVESEVPMPNIIKAIASDM